MSFFRNSVKTAKGKGEWKVGENLKEEHTVTVMQRPFRLRK
jgi:hypothetical protein